MGVGAAAGFPCDVIKCCAGIIKNLVLRGPLQLLKQHGVAALFSTIAPAQIGVGTKTTTDNKHHVVGQPLGRRKAHCKKHAVALLVCPVQKVDSIARAFEYFLLHTCTRQASRSLCPTPYCVPAVPGQDSLPPRLSARSPNTWARAPLSQECARSAFTMLRTAIP